MLPARVEGEFYEAGDGRYDHSRVEVAVGGAVIVRDKEPNADAEYDGVKHSVNDQVRDLYFSIYFHRFISGRSS